MSQEKNQYIPYTTRAPVPPASAYYPQLPVAGQAYFPPMEADNNGQPRDWSSGLCACDAGGCLKSTFVSCFVYGEIKQRLAHLQSYGVPIDERAIGNSGQDTATYAVVEATSDCSFLLDVALRGDVRKRYNIDGSWCGDCCIVSWCSACSQQQVLREVKREEQQLRERMNNHQMAPTPQMKF